MIYPLEKTLENNNTLEQNTVYFHIILLFPFIHPMYTCVKKQC